VGAASDALMMMPDDAARIANCFIISIFRIARELQELQD